MKPVWALPEVTWTSLMPSMSRSTSSTFTAAALASARLVPAGRTCRTVMLFSPERPSRSVASSGVMAAVPPRTRTAAMSVTTGCFWVLLRIGKVAALQRACAARPRAPWQRFPGRRLGVRRRRCRRVSGGTSTPERERWSATPAVRKAARWSPSGRRAGTARRRVRRRRRWEGRRPRWSGWMP